MKHTLFFLCCFLFMWGPLAFGDDLIELTSGAKSRGKILSQSGSDITMEVTIGGTAFQRKYPKSRIAAVTIDGKRTPYKNGKPTTSSEPSASATETSKDAILKRIDEIGRTPPDWYDATPLNYPDTLDLSWPKPAPKPWNSQKNVGQYIWDRINPNPQKWREGVKLMHHIMLTQKDNPETVQQAMQALATMYHNLLQDYERAAFWWHQAGLRDNPQSAPSLAAVHLANCYLQLGSKEMVNELMEKIDRYPYAAIKLLGDMGETDKALRMADQFAKTGNALMCYLYAGDVCRVAGRLDEAETYYRKAIDAGDKDTRNDNHKKRDIGRAQASLAALKFYNLNLDRIQDGTYKASSLGYEGQVQVEVKVQNGRITDVKVVQHREKQFYSSITETPRAIIEAQAVTGIDTTSGATITSEAIINATAKALAKQLD